jgi:membrane protein DedA with SNARE-associated domain
MIESLIAHGSYVAIVAVLVLTGVGLPVPEEVPVIAAGMLSAHGHLDPWAALACCLLGALGGDCALYYVGYRFGHGLLRGRRFWSRVLTPRREARAEALFRQHGLKVFFIARFLVGLRTPVYLTAGILRVPFRRFLMIDLFCAAVVVGTVFGLSHYYGTTIVAWVRHAEILLTALAALAAAATVFYLWRRRRRKRQAAGASPGVGPVSPPAETAPAEAAAPAEGSEALACEEPVGTL